MVAVSYWFWIELCFEKNGYYPYPIFESAGSTGRVGLFVGSAVLMGAVSVGLGRVYRVVNGQELLERKNA